MYAHTRTHTERCITNTLLIVSYLIWTEKIKIIIFIILCLFSFTSGGISLAYHSSLGTVTTHTYYIIMSQMNTHTFKS